MMQIATKGRLAVIAMLDLALRTDPRPVALASIGARQRISLSYLEEMFAGLRRRGLVRSTRGAGGGYNLARSAADISVVDIVLAADDPAQARTRAADRPPGCDYPQDHRIVSDWCTELDGVMTQYLASVSLQDLAGPQPRESSKADAPENSVPRVLQSAQCRRFPQLNRTQKEE